MTRMITILGPTASGKTTLAAALAYAQNGEIISADSRQVYRRMDIGTGKDLDEYIVKGQQIPYHLINIIEPGSKYNIFEYQKDFHKVYTDILSRGTLPILCGGSGLYIETVLRGYELSVVSHNEQLQEELKDKTLSQLTDILIELKQKNGSKMHNTTDVDTPKRALRAIEIELHKAQHPYEQTTFQPIDSLIIGIDIDREERRKKISRRLKERLRQGMIAEIEGLLSSGIAAEDLIYYGLEYKFVTEYVTKRISYNEMFDRLEVAIHQFAKRQMTWFRGMERRGLHIHWIDAKLPTDDKIDAINELMNI